MKFLENLGVIAIVGVWISLTIWGMLQGILDSRSVFTSVVIVVIWIGVLILLIAAMVRRYKEAKCDPYKDVEI